MKNCIVIADWARDPFTVEECRSALLGHLNGKTPSLLSFIPVQNDREAGAGLKRIMDTEQRIGDPNNLVYFISVDEKSTQPFYILRMKNGAIVCGPNSGYSFSYIYKDIEYLYQYSKQPLLHHENLFLSRDLFAPILALLVTEKIDEMELEEVRVSGIEAM